MTELDSHMSELRFTGRMASRMLAAGPPAVVSSLTGSSRVGRVPAAETEPLRNAIRDPLGQLSDFAALAEGNGSDILAFRIDLLEEEPNAGYETAHDTNFKALACALRDINAQEHRTSWGAGSDLGSPPGAIAAGADLKPSSFLAIDWSQGGGIALAPDSASGHVGALTRARVVEQVNNAAYEFRIRPVITVDGTAIAVYIDVDNPIEIQMLDPANCDGIESTR
jgi:phosphoenolpyruvate-protein phosphotransferase (PTS system enzyme I)